MLYNAKEFYQTLSDNYSWRRLHTEPNKRLYPYQALNHPFFDDLKKKDFKLPNGKSLPKHIFQFKECEIQYDKENINKILKDIK